MSSSHSDDEEIDFFNCVNCGKPIETNDKKAILRHERICEKKNIDMNNTPSNNVENIDYNNNADNTENKEEMSDLDYLLSMARTPEISIISKEMIISSSITNSISATNSQSNNNIEIDFNKIQEINLSHKDLRTIVNKKKIDFSELNNLLILNISNNKLSQISFIMSFSNNNIIKELYINDNYIESILPIEKLPNLVVLDVSNNNLTIISSLAKTSKLVRLNISNNKICYSTSSMKILKDLRGLKELGIQGNPVSNLILLFLYCLSF